MQTGTLFDALTGAANPTDLFGAFLEGAHYDFALHGLHEHARISAARVQETFRVVVGVSEPGISALDHVIAEMWAQHWPGLSAPSFNLFATDFGALLSVAVLSLPSASAVFRSTTVLDHMSVWVGSRNTEYFPFHKAAKALLRPDGESLSQLYRAVRSSGTAA